MQLLQGDSLEVLKTLPDCSVHCCVTSPPYWGLRDYGVDGQIGLEDTLAEFIDKLVAVFREVRRVLRDDGTCWVNMGDAYCTNPRGNREGDVSTSSLTNPKRQDKLWGKHKYRNAAREPRNIAAGNLKNKDLIGQPWALAFALRADGWWLRQDIIWHKPNPMPESNRDRCSKAHEYIFLLTKSARYYYDQEAIVEPVSAATHRRLAQNVEAQIGSDRAHAGKKSNGPMKAVGRKAGKVGREKNNASMDAALTIMPDTRNKRSVWGALEEVVAMLVRHRADKKVNDRQLRAWALEELSTLFPGKSDVWAVATKGYKGAHFATFPPKLIEPCILAGCPNRCCGKCGAPWVREIAVSYDNPGNRTTNGPRSVANRKQTAGFEQRLEKRVKTLGFNPTCECEAEPKGGTVLDPFNGSGTTGQVALEHGCNYIGIELNPEYLELARNRLKPLLDQRRMF